MTEEVNALADLDIREDQLLGTGYISSVFRAIHRTTGKTYAVKAVG
jgi:hypothetical protein